jgi:acyl-CoA synthetase (AMP-forming)/AMP-acid ligase II
MVATRHDSQIFHSPLPAPRADRPLVVAALRHAAADPGRAAVVDGVTGQRFSRGELVELSSRLAAGLADRGIFRGHVVALAMPNVPWWPVVALGVWRAGAALATLNPAWRAEETARAAALVRPRVLITERAQIEELLGPAPADPFAEPQLDQGDLAVVPFSSGLGGLPKGVRLTHLNLSAASANLATAIRLEAGSVELAGAPLSSIMGMASSLFTTLGTGGTLVTLPRPTAEAVIEAMARHRITQATLPPTVVEQIANAGDCEGYDTPDLEHVLTGGDRVAAAVQLRASERLGALVRQAYGMTEAIGISSTLIDRPSDPATVGWLAPGTEARVVDPDTGRDVAPGRAGELWIRGSQVMEGYYEDPEATQAMLTPDGWLRTGDLVRIRDDGQVVIEDRIKELIKVKGASVAPAELELVLRQHPAVREAAVFGRPDAKRGEVPVAWVVLSGSATQEDLLSFVRSRVAAHKRLHDVRIVDELPRSPSGKLARRELRDRERHSAAAGRSATRDLAP